MRNIRYGELVTSMNKSFKMRNNSEGDFMRQILFISTVILLVLLVMNINNGSNFKFTKTTDLSNENIHGYFLNDDLSNEPKWKEIKQRGQTEYAFYELELINGIHVITDNKGKIMRFLSDLTTAKGVKIGDTKMDIIKAYGENYTIEEDYPTGVDEGIYNIRYVDKVNGITLKFRLFNEKVEVYELFNTSLEKQLQPAF
jgi:hypothetical protein